MTTTAHSGRNCTGIGGLRIVRIPSRAAGDATSPVIDARYSRISPYVCGTIAAGQLDRLGDPAHLARVAVGVGIGEPAGIRAVRDDERLDLDRVDPQQQVGIVGAVRASPVSGSMPCMRVCTARTRAHAASAAAASP